MTTTSPNPLSPGAPVGIDEAVVSNVVHTFYARVRSDPDLGPIFDEAVHDWPRHLERLTDFWSSVTLMTGAYKGQPMQAHFRLPHLPDALFVRWLDLFRGTLRDVCTPEQSEVFMVRAERIADNFRFGLATLRGEVAEPLARAGA